mgnify:CR=1 FL=1
MLNLPNPLTAQNQGLSFTKQLNENVVFWPLVFFPNSMKHALVKPLIKKPSLDHNDLKNYRPVSNLSLLSKVLERLALEDLNDHLLAEFQRKPVSFVSLVRLVLLAKTQFGFLTGF